MIRLRILMEAACIMVAGCNTVGIFPSETGKPWKDADDNGVPLSKGAAECKYQAKAMSAQVTGVPQDAAVAGDLYEQCMRRRGYLGGS